MAGASQADVDRGVEARRTLTGPEPHSDHGGRATGLRLWHTAAVFAIAAATFVPALHNGLLADDSLLLEQRLDSSHAGSLPGLFQQSYWGELHASGLYRPLSLTLLSAQRRAFGTDGAPYRFVNLVLHGLCSVLVLSWLRHVVAPGGAFAGAVLFAVHPIHAETVITIYGQSDLWCALFFLAAVSVYGWHPSAERSSLRLAGTGLLYFLSLLSKEQGVLLPALLLLVPRGADAALRGRGLQRRALVLIVPLVLYMVLRANALGAAFAPWAEASVATGYPWWARINLMIVTAGTYLRLLVVPWGQTTYYGHLRDALFGTPLLEIGVLALAALSFRPLRGTLGRPVVNQASAILAFTLLPVANLIPIGMVVGERCLYLPSVAICLLAGAAYVRLQSRAFRAAVLAICLAAVTGVALSVRVAFRWQTPLRHWETTAADHNRSAGAHARLALLLLQDVADTPTAPGDPRLRQAEVAVRRALDINPRLAEAWEARALLAIVQQDCAAAAEALRQAASLRPPSPEMSRVLERCRQ